MHCLITQRLGLKLSCESQLYFLQLNNRLNLLGQIPVCLRVLVLKLQTDDPTSHKHKEEFHFIPLKIFGDHQLNLTVELEAETQEIMLHDDCVYMAELSNGGIKSMIHEMKL